MTIWLVISLAGAAAALYGLLDAIRDQRALNGESNGRSKLAGSAIRSQTLHLLALSLAAGLGVALIADGRQPDWTPTVITLLAIVALVTANVVLDARDRVFIRRYLASK